jgi:hypothetical protein
MSSPMRLKSPNSSSSFEEGEDGQYFDDGNTPPHVYTHGKQQNAPRVMIGMYVYIYMCIFLYMNIYILCICTYICL